MPYQKKTLSSYRPPSLLLVLQRQILGHFHCKAAQSLSLMGGLLPFWDGSHDQALTCCHLNQCRWQCKSIYVISFSLCMRICKCISFVGLVETIGSWIVQLFQDTEKVLVLSQVWCSDTIRGIHVYHTPLGQSGSGLDIYQVAFLLIMDWSQKSLWFQNTQRIT